MYKTQETNDNEFSGLSMNFGTQFKTKINKLDFVSSFTLSPQTNFKVKNTRELVKVIEINSTIPIQETNDRRQLPSILGKTALGSKISFGSGIGKLKNWFVGFESNFQDANTFPSKFITTPTTLNNARFSASNKISVGGYYVPDYTSFSNYLKRITYRGGFKHENTGLIISGNSINDTSLNVGFGLPLGSSSFSNLNLGFEIGKRGTKNSGLVQENYMNVFIGLSLNDKWFTKRKID